MTPNAVGRTAFLRLSLLAPLLAIACLIAPSAWGFEAFDGRLQAHGYFESQLRVLNEDFREEYDVSQWYQVFDLELELDLLDDTVGILDLMSAYVRAEVRYDCIYSHGCGMFRTMNAYGDRSRSLPRRLSNAHALTYAGDLYIRQTPRLSGSNTDPVPLTMLNGFKTLADTDGQLVQIKGCSNDVRPWLCDDGEQQHQRPFDYAFDRFLGFRFTQINGKGGSDSGLPIQILGPWLPKNFIEQNATMADRANPFDSSRINPVLRLPGNGARPFRPIPIYAEDPSLPGQTITQYVIYNNGDPTQPSPVMEQRKIYNHGDARFQADGMTQRFLAVPDENGVLQIAYDARDALKNDPAFRQNPDYRVLISSDVPGLDTSQYRGATDRSQARGLFLPSPPLRQAISTNRLDGGLPLNFRQAERAWNRGASQQDEKELKEAYLDVELFDSRLWMRIGKQQIVWGKTELFRTTDQFNPQDLALASLPSLEESRIGLWAVRGIWSFYEVGPLSDVRLELAFNFDDYEPSDFGACGEAYTVNLVCSASFGAFAHGFTGVGIAGFDKPDDPWDSTKGWEVGGRLEWRWDRFSFALTDFYGYADLPSIDRITTYQRAVDTQTGRALIYDGSKPSKRRVNLSYQAVVDTGNPDDPATPVNESDPWIDVADLLAEATRPVDPVIRNPTNFLVNDAAAPAGSSTRDGCAISLAGAGGTPTDRLRFNRPSGLNLAANGAFLDGDRCLHAGPTKNLDDSALPVDDRSQRAVDRQVADPNSPSYDPNNALDASQANLTLFTWICSTSVGILDLDPTSCAVTVFGSAEEASAGIAVGEVIGRLLGGDPLLNGLLTVDNDGPGTKFLPFALPIVLLSNDPGDTISLGCTDFEDPTVPCGGRLNPRTHLGAVLSPEQEALLGCGPFWGTSCDISGIDLLNTEFSALLQSFAGASGTLTSIRMKEQGISYPGTALIDPVTGKVQPFRDPSDYRTDEGLQPGTLPWEASGIGGPLCTTADLGGEFAPRGADLITVPTSPYPVAKPGSRKSVLPGCHRKWIDRQQGTLNPAWGEPQRNPDGTPVRDVDGNVVINYFYYSGNPDPLGVRNEPLTSFEFPDSVYSFEFGGPGDDSLTSPLRPDVGPGQPFAGRRPSGMRPNTIVPFASEMAGLSWNFQMILVSFSDEFQDALETVGDLADPTATSVPGGNPIGTTGGDRRLIAQMLMAYCGSDYGIVNPETGLGTCQISGRFNDNAGSIPNGIKALTREYLRQGISPTAPGDADKRQAYQDQLQFINVPLINKDDREFRTTDDNPPVTGQNQILENKHCSFIQPQYCSLLQSVTGLAGLQRNTLRAGGNGTYGRRTGQWQSGGEIVLYAPKRNVLGFSLDFAEDRTKSNFSIEATWIEGVPVGDNTSWNNVAKTDEFNLTVSVDRPTFINFLNPNRTIFFNSQWFFQYRQGWERSFGGNGPYNVLFTLTAFTGYFQDRLNPSITFVHDVQSFSGALLPSIGYRFTENFSATVGFLFFYGRDQLSPISENGIGPASNQQGPYAYSAGGPNGLAIVRDRDEVFLRIRYTF